MIKNMRSPWLKPVCWIPIIGVILTATFAWGAWNTLATSAALPETKFEEHEKDNNSKFMQVLDEIREQREAIEDKLDKIQEKL